MPDNAPPDGIAAGRLAPDQIRQNFSDLHPPLTRHEAAVAADRCYFCFDAPCVTACPTTIDIPLFIRQIATGQEIPAARTILDANILGGMCARVCPTETLCEEACVREAAEGKPVQIGLLQRFATDAIMAEPHHPFTRAAPTGKRIAVVGSGPAGLACAHRLAMHGNDVVVFDAKAKAGGLNEFGIAAYKVVNDFAQAELDWLLGIGGIEMRHGARLGPELTLDGLCDEFDAVFLGLGLGGVRALSVPGSELAGVIPAVDFIADLRQCADLATMPVGARVVVIGGGMTAIDAAVQARGLGAEDVTLAYRGPRQRMSASAYEQDIATRRGVRILTDMTPTRIDNTGNGLAVQFDTPSGARALKADQVMLAIGQTPGEGISGLAVADNGKIEVNHAGATSLPGVWAGGDCATGGDDLTVTAVAEGRDAAEAIHASLSG